MKTKSIHKKEARYYLRGVPHNRLQAGLLLILPIVFFLLSAFYISLVSSAPDWSICLGSLIVVSPLCWILIASDHYIFFDDKALTLCSGNVLTQKKKVIAPLGDFFEVLYLPHTREVKLVRGSGTRFLKLHDGERFVTQFGKLFEEVVKLEKLHESGHNDPKEA